MVVGSRTQVSAMEWICLAHGPPTIILVTPTPTLGSLLCASGLNWKSHSAVVPFQELSGSWGFQEKLLASSQAT